MALFDETHVCIWMEGQCEVCANAGVQLLCSNVECCVKVCAYVAAYRIE